MSIDSARVAAFEEDLLGWLEAARPGVPVFTQLDPPAIRSGACISCGTSIPSGWPCAERIEAVHHVMTEFSR